jgi:KAP family P-loop domain
LGTASTVGKVITALVAGISFKVGPPGALELSFEAAHGDLRYVVFIDDLDRCLPQGALEVREAIKLFFEKEQSRDVAAQINGLIRQVRVLRRSERLESAAMA